MKQSIFHSCLLTAVMAASSLSYPIQAQGILDTGKGLLGSGNGATAGIGGIAGNGGA